MSFCKRIYNFFTSKTRCPKIHAPLKFNSINEIEKQYNFAFPYSAKGQYGDTILSIFNGNYFIEIATIAELNNIDLLLIFGMYNINVTKDELLIRKIYERLIALKCETAYILYGHHLCKNDDDEKSQNEGINILKMAIKDFDSKSAKYLLAKHYMVDNIVLGLPYLIELANEHYFPAVFDLILYLNEQDDIESLKKIIHLPFTINLENTENVKKQMDIIIRIIKARICMFQIYPIMIAIENPNEYIRIFIEKKM